MVKLLYVALAVTRMSDGCDKTQPVATSASGSATSAEDTGPHTTLTPAARAKLDKLIGGSGSGSAIVVATPHAHKATTPATSTPPSAPSKVETYPQYGSHWSKDRMMSLPEIDHNDDNWAFEFVGRTEGQVHNGNSNIYVAHQCIDHSGCTKTPSGSYEWKAIGWWTD
jgi:hypothetical protein